MISIFQKMKCTLGENIGEKTNNNIDFNNRSIENVYALTIK